MNTSFSVTPTAYQSVILLLTGLILTLPGGSILFLLAASNFRLAPDLLQPSGIFFELVALGFFCFGVYLVVLCARSFRRVLRWQTKARIASGVIQAVREERQESGGGRVNRPDSHYLVKYRFEVRGVPYLLLQFVSRQQFAGCYTGQVVRVKYLPDRPHVSRIIKYR